MNIQDIHIAATEFRKAIEEISSELGIAFASFPRGACGDTTPLLGTYLIERELGEFQYMSGELRDSAEEPPSTHAWLQSENLVVDITADQFEGINESVIVTEDSSWHRSLNGEAKHLADYHCYDSQTVESLSKQYTKIVNVIQSP